MDSNSANKDILRPLTPTELDDLLLLYKNNYSKTNFHYISLYTQCKWNRQLNDLDGNEQDSKWKPFKKFFFTHRNGNLANGTYVSLHWDLMLSVQFYSLEESWDELKECLLKTKLIDWSSGPLVTGVLINNYEFVTNILKEVGALVDRARECHCLLLSPVIALRLPEPELPEGLTWRQLVPSDVDLVHSLWANKNEGSLDYVRGFTRLNKTLGLIRLRDDALVGWIFQNEFSGLGILQVLPEEQRIGLGQILGIKMSKMIASEEEIDISAFIVKGNTKSEGLLTKIGFKHSTRSMWIQCKQLRAMLNQLVVQVDLTQKLRTSVLQFGKSDNGEE